MRTNGIALGRVSDSADDGSAHGRVRMSPRDRDRVDAERVGVGCQVNVVEGGYFRDRDAVVGSDDWRAYALLGVGGALLF